MELKQNDTSLGKCIRSLRLQAGMTQDELAGELNVTRQALSNWERDLACPDIDTLPKLAKILGVSADELMQAKAQTRETPKASGLQSTLNTVFKALTCAMGAAVTVLSALGRLDSRSAFSLLGIGLFCAGMALLQDKK